MAKMSRFWPWIVYGLVALTVLLPLLGRGYILTLDMVFTPHIRMPTSVGSSYVFRVLLHVMNYALPSDVIEKLLLLTILLLSGVGGYLLITYSFGKKIGATERVGCYFAGVVYMINPFTYDRLMAGQYSVLLGYSLLPWFMCSLLNFLQKPGLRTSLLMSVWMVIISIVSIHAIGFMAILVVFAGATELWRRRMDRQWTRRLTEYSVVVAILFLVASSYWLLPILLGHGHTATELSSFSTADRTSFATLGGSLWGRLGNVLLLQGFWAEGQNLYILPQDHLSFWFALAPVVWVLVVTGIISTLRRHQRRTTAVFGGSAIVAVFLAIGGLNGWLAAHVPFFSGYREPEKFVALVALGFAVFAGHGVTAIIGRWQNKGRRILFAGMTMILLAVPFIWTSVMLWGCSNQLTPVQYPADWFATNARLDTDPSSFQVLFLPWHLYTYFDFEGRIIASPAPQFFDKPTIISNDPEFAALTPSGNSEANRIGEILAAAATKRDLAVRLTQFHIKYIVLALDDDFTNYDYLNHQDGLHRVSKSATLEVYKNEFLGGR